MNPTDDQKRGFNRGYAIRGTHSKPTGPRSPCPICLLDGTSTCTTELMQWRCPRGHEWTGTRQQGLKHAFFCNAHHAQDTR